MPDVLLEVDAEGVALITLNRPRQRNAMSANLSRELAAAIRECEERDDVKSAVIYLIVEQEERATAPPAPEVKPHFSTAESREPKVGSRFQTLFGGKHCMLSYNWGVQEDVNAVRAQLAAAGVPTWMDIDGEPAGIATSAQMLLAG